MKKALSILLAVCIVLTGVKALSLSAGAVTEDYASTGEISGDFDYYVYSDGTAGITNYYGSDPVVTIPSTLGGVPVTRIGSYAFQSKQFLTGVVIPESVTRIEARAFEYCANLSSITIPNSLLSIGARAFDGTAWLSAVPQDTVAYLGSIAYKFNGYGDSSMSITLKEGTTAIADSAFYRCRGLDQITIPQGVERIGANAFSGCALTSISIPSSVTYIGDSAFDAPLENITFHGGVTELSSSAFIYTNWYQNQPDGLVYVDRVAYSYKGEHPSFVSIKSGTLTVGDELFSLWTDLTSVTLPNTLQYIGKSAFFGCTGLSSISIPSGVTKIGNRAFKGCTGLSSVKIPDGVTVITDNMFADCTHLQSVQLPADLTIIEYEAFEHDAMLKSIRIPDGVTRIGTDAFLGCGALSAVSIPAKVVAIGNGVFSECGGLESLSVSEQNTVYDSRDNCNAIIETASGKLLFGIKNSTIPDGVTAIADKAFAGCDGLTSIHIPDGVTTIGYRAFDGCTRLSTIRFPDDITDIDTAAFNNTAWYNNMPDGLVYIGKMAYRYKGECPSSITIKPGTVTIGRSLCSNEMQWGVFANLTSVTLPDSVVDIKAEAFRACTALVSINFPKGLKHIGYLAFHACAFSEIDLPDGLKEVDNLAFSSCNNLMSVTIPDSVEVIGEEAFGFIYGQGLWGYMEGFTVKGYTGSEAERYVDRCNKKHDQIHFHFVSIGQSRIERTLTDEESGISVELTDDADLLVEVIDQTDWDVQTDDTILAVYDIMLMKNSTFVQPNGSIKISIPCTDTEAKVYRVGDNGIPTDMQAEYKDGYLVFETDRLSLYAVTKAKERILGDADTDGSITILDATAIQRDLAVLSNPAFDRIAADADSDGTVSILDATAIQRFLASLPTNEGIGKAI